MCLANEKLFTDAGTHLNQRMNGRCTSIFCFFSRPDVIFALRTENSMSITNFSLQDFFPSLIDNQ